MKFYEASFYFSRTISSYSECSPKLSILNDLWFSEKDGEEAGANKKPRNNRRRGGRGTSNGKEARDKQQDGDKESKKQNKDTVSKTKNSDC